MTIGYILFGFMIGALLAGSGSSFLLGAVGGAIIGALFARLVQVEQRLEELETRQRQDSQRPIRSPAQPQAQSPAAPAVPTPAPPPGSGQSEASVTAAEPQAQAASRASVSLPPHLEAAAATEPGRATSPPRAGKKTPVGLPPLLQDGLGRVGQWFATGNVPVKVGVILSFIGVAFLLKYAIDAKLVSVPIEVRLLAVAAAGLLMTALGWRLRERLRVYGLSLQGGGMGILFLTIFAAFRVWQLLPASWAFVLLVVLAFCMGALAVIQKARSLIVLGVIGGFLAPVLASTGQGSHVALFSYYLVLNAAILGVTWFHAWRELNLVGFIFTFVIGSLWGYRYYQPELFTSTEPFLVLYFLFYHAIAILFALRQPPERVGLVDGTLVFGTPVIAFALQAALLRGSEYGLAISAAVVAVFYAITAMALFRRKGEYLRVLTESYIALAVAFATLAIPLALDANWTAAAWALEGAALVWVGTRQGRHLATLSGVALIGLSSLAFLDHGWRHNAGWPVLNQNVLGGLLISLSALFAARQLEGFGVRLVAIYRLLAWCLFAWGVLWWLGTGSAELGDRLPDHLEAHALVGFVALSAVAAVMLGRRLDWVRLRRMAFLYLPALFVLALLYQWDSPHHFLYGWGWLAWPVALAVQLWMLCVMDDYEESLAANWHVGSLLLLTAWLASEVQWQVRQSIAGAWSLAAAVSVPGLIALLVWKLRLKPEWPIPAHPLSYRGASLVLVLAELGWLASMSVELPGDPSPLAYLPLLNPFDLAMLFALAIAVLSLLLLRRDEIMQTRGSLEAWLPAYHLVLGLFVFVITTAALVRGVHHLVGVSWHFDTLKASDTVQTALSIYWGLLGFCGMLLGTRRGWRGMWLLGAGFMALVVIKLFTVDLGNSGTIERIVSFIGVGVLLLVVGYFAPAPPRQAAGTEPPTEGAT